LKQVLEYVSAFVTITLILAGLGGVSYNMFKDHGWLGMILGKWWEAQLANPVIAIAVTIAVFIVGKLWYDHNQATGHTSKLPDVLIYIIMAGGVYFLYQFVVNGSF